MQSAFKYIAVHMIILLLCGVGVAHAGAVSGSFLYTEEKDRILLNYEVQAIDYQGTPAWKVMWSCPQIDAEHYIRQSDNAPLHVKRVNRVLNHTVEVVYSTEAGKPHSYTRKTANKVFEKKIWRAGLRDLGTLPQMLLDLKDSEDAAGISFPAIQYATGEVYDLVAKKQDHGRVDVDGKEVSSVIYHININSWLSVLCPPVKIEIPASDKNINFFTYSGPDLADSGITSTFSFSDTSSRLAALK